MEELREKTGVEFSRTQIVEFNGTLERTERLKK